jgi:hypothetical protein
VNSKAYLVEQKGIDPKRIEVRTVKDGAETKALLWIVPRGASLDVTNSSGVDESQVKPVPRTIRGVK